MNDNAVLLQGDCLEILKTLPDDSLDSLITDPPAGIAFMGKEWDEDKGGRKQWIAWMTEVMQECLRVLKPGAHGLVWAIPRTSHWTATALEDAGFEVRDVVTHIFGSGFPKSMDISKAIDKAAGAEREVVGPNKFAHLNGKANKNTYGEAKQWQGWGTALKPASEHWILVRKPISEKTVAANVLEHGTGGINIDASRIGINADDPNHRKPSVGYADGSIFGIGGGKTENLSPQGRFPANLVLNHNADCDDTCTPGCAVAALDKQSLAGGMHSAGSPRQKVITSEANANSYSGKYSGTRQSNRVGDSGGASRFFYCAKASKKDKGANNPHPTVKSSTLMSYLIKLITPPNGIVLDPFMGSGSTGVAALKEGFAFVGIEKEQEYFDIAEKRVG